MSVSVNASDNDMSMLCFYLNLPPQAHVLHAWSQFVALVWKVFCGLQEAGTDWRKRVLGEGGPLEAKALPRSCVIRFLCAVM